MRAQSSSKWRGWMVALTVGTMLSAVWPPTSVAAQDESGLQAETIARYVVDVEGAAVDVTFETTLTNDADGVAFTTVAESIPSAAVDVTATGNGRPLTMVPLGIEDGFTQWLIELRTSLDPGESLTLILTWRLEPVGTDVVVAPGVVSFDAYVGGTAAVARSALIVEAPEGFEAVVADDLEVIEGDDRLTIFTGDAQPYVPVPIVVEREDRLLRDESSADPRLTLADWEDDGRWSREVDRLLPEVVSLLDDWFGVAPGPVELRRRPRSPTDDAVPTLLVPAGTGPAVVTVGPEADRIELARELAGWWLADLPATEPWLVAGLADAVSGSPPNDPAAAVVPVVADEIGGPGVRRVVDALRRGSISYPGAGDEGDEPQPIDPDWRTVLDLFEQVGGASAEDLFRANVVDVDDSSLLDRRAAARVDYLALEARAGDWALPPIVRIPMAAWDFEIFAARQAEVSDALVARDLLRADLGEADLELGGIAQAAFETADSDMTEVIEILERQASAEEALTEAKHLVEGDRGLLAWIGLFGDDTDAELREAMAAWDAGQFGLAESRAHLLADRVDGAVGRGTLRLVLPALLVLVVVTTLRGLLRRSRPPRRVARREESQPAVGS